MSDWIPKEQAQRIADRLGIVIPGHTLVDAVPLVLIEALLDRIEKLEK